MDEEDLLEKFILKPKSQFSWLFLLSRLCFCLLRSKRYSKTMAKSATFEVAPKTKVQISQSSEGLRRQTILGFEAEGM